ncbi:recombination protein NinB [Ochrobactrum sp. EDr1-4]
MRNLPAAAHCASLIWPRAYSVSQTDGRKPRKPEEWKVLLVSGHSVATKQQAEIVPGLEGEFINICESTARMSVERACGRTDTDICSQ